MQSEDEMRPALARKFMVAALAVLAAILLLYGLARSLLGLSAPEGMDKNLPNAAIAAALGIFLWNRKIRADEDRAAAAAAKAAEAVPAAAAPAATAPAEAPRGGDDE
jgi:uncharacterized heparinase superfamily protein